MLGITGRRVRQLAEDGTLEKAGRGKYNLAKCVRQYSDSKEAASDEDMMKLNRQKLNAEVRFKKAKADIARMEADELEGRMHRSEDVAAMTTDLIYSIRAALLALPGRLAVNVTSAQSAAEASEIIRREVFDVMDELRRYEYDPKAYEERVRARRAWEAAEGADDNDNGE